MTEEWAIFFCLPFECKPIHLAERGSSKTFHMVSVCVCFFSSHPAHAPVCLCRTHSVNTQLKRNTWLVLTAVGVSLPPFYPLSLPITCADTEEGDRCITELCGLCHLLSGILVWRWTLFRGLSVFWTLWTTQGQSLLKMSAVVQLTLEDSNHVCLTFVHRPVAPVNGLNGTWSVWQCVCPAGFFVGFSWPCLIKDIVSQQILLPLLCSYNNKVLALYTGTLLL